MSVKETGAELPELPSAADINYAWTDIVLRRPIADVNKPIDEQNIKLAVRCIGTLDGASVPMQDRQISATWNAEELIALAATPKSQIKKFVALCEKGCAKENQTYTDDFVI
jgi:hypothetical protein